MNWIKEAESDLRRYRSLSESLSNIPEQLKYLEEKLQSVRSSWADSTPVQGGANRREDEQINVIVKMDRLKQNYMAVKRLVDLMDGALSKLTKDEVNILNMAYINQNKKAIELICEEYHVERSRAYELRNIALKKFTLKMYGIIDL